jgi:uncharacterized ferredoxin-like protein
MLAESEFKTTQIIEIAKNMAIAARTAPKGRGRNTVEVKIALGEDLEIIAQKMEEMGNENGQQFFIRDSANIRNSDAILLIGTEIKSLGLRSCGLCGMKNCENKNTNTDIPCAFNNIDLGIALGSAVSIAADSRLDNRIMFSVGMAVRELKYFDENIKIILGISLSASSKSIYFDRQV